METILLIDGDKLFRWALGETLRAAGYEVLEATNGECAREMFCPEVDLVVSDCHLPDGSGLRLLQELKGSPSRCPVILLSAYPTENESEATTTGAYRCMSKPNDPEEIVLVVRQALSSASRA